MKTITISDFRKEPGEYLRSVDREHESFLITKSGKPVAKLVPIERISIVDGHGKVYGELPLTAKMTRAKRSGSY